MILNNSLISNSVWSREFNNFFLQKDYNLFKIVKDNSNYLSNKSQDRRKKINKIDLQKITVTNLFEYEKLRGRSATQKNQVGGSNRFTKKS